VEKDQPEAKHLWRKSIKRIRCYGVRPAGVTILWSTISKRVVNAYNTRSARGSTSMEEAEQDSKLFWDKSSKIRNVFIFYEATSGNGTALYSNLSKKYHLL
jgi:hypothetical protein